MSYNSLFNLGSHSGEVVHHFPLQGSGDLEDQAGVLGSPTIVGSSPTTDSSGPKPWLPSGIVRANITDEIRWAYPSDLQGISEWTIGGYFKLAAYDANISELLASFGGTASARYNYVSWVGKDTVTYIDGRIRVSNGSTGGDKNYGANNIPTGGEWQHLVGSTSMAGGGQRIFDLEGYTPQSFSESISGTTYTGSGELHLGNYYGGNQGLVGSLAGIAFFARQLSDAEIAEWRAGPEPINTVLPTLNMGVTSWTGTIGTWDSQNNGTISYTWELRLVEDDSVVESGGGEYPQGTGTYSNANGYYLAVEAANDGGTDLEARSKVGTLGVGLNAWYDATLGQNAKDLQGSSDGTLVNVALVADADGEATSAWEFNGTNAFIDIPGGITHNKSEYTVSLWFKDDGPAATAKILWNVGESNGDRTSSFGITGTAGNDLIGGHGTWVSGGGSVNTGDWVHAVYRFEANGVLRLYKDGVQVASTSGNAAPTTGQSLARIGQYVAGGLFHTGRMDSIRLYDRDLANSEIAELYTSGRGYDHRPKGLGDENLWYCPSIEDSPNDLSGNGYNGTYLGLTATTSDTGAGGQLAYDCTSNGNTEIRGLQGPSERVDISDSFSFSWWYKLTESYVSTVNHYAFDCRAGNNTSNYSGFALIHRGSNLTGAIQRGNLWISGNGGLSTGLASGDLTDWHHFCVTFDHTTNEVKTWVDGVNTDTDTATFTPPATQPASPATTVGYLGNYSAPAAFYTASGNMDDSRHFTRVLNEAEIKHLATGRGVLGSPIQGLGDEVAWYCPTLSGNAGDLSGNGNAGEYQGGMAVVEDVNSGGKKAYDSTSSTSDAVIASNTGDYSFEPYSMSAWIKLSDYTATAPTIQVFLSHSDGTTNNGWRMSAVYNSGVRKLGFTLGGVADYVISASAIQDNDWHHAAYTVDGTTLKAYLDGVYIEEKTIGTRIGVPDQITIGKYQANVNSSFDGYLDDLRIYDRVLTQDEIAHLASDRGVQGTPIVGLGDEKLWLCPSIEDSARDLTNGGNDGTYQNGTYTLSSTEEGGQRAYGFDGVDNRIDCPSTVLGGSQAFSASCWAYINAHDFTYGEGIVGQWDSSTSANKVFLIYTGPSTSFRGIVTTGSVNYISEASGTSPPTGGWHHLALVYDGSNVTLYVDAVSQGSTAVSGTVASSPANDVEIGRYEGSGGVSNRHCLNGAVDDVRLYDRALTEAEVAHLATGRGVLGSPPTGLGDEKAWYCPTLSGNASDLSGNGNAGEYNGGMEVTHDTDGTAAFEFDGVDDYIDTPFSFSGTDASFSAWAYRGVDSPGTLMGQDGVTNSGKSLLVNVGSSSIAATVVDSSAGSTVAADTKPAAGSWFHVAGVYDADGNLDLYVDGVSVATTAATGVGINNTTTTRFEIGTARTGVQPYFDGLMDDIRIYDRVLTEDEIYHLSTERGVTGTPPAFTGVAFRTTSGYVTDPTRFVADVYPAQAYTAGAGYGWSMSNAVDYRDRTTSLDPLLAGLAFTSVSGRYFRIDLPGGIGTYRVSAAFYDHLSTNGTGWRFKDGTTEIAFVDGSVSSSIGYRNILDQPLPVSGFDQPTEKWIEHTFTSDHLIIERDTSGLSFQNGIISAVWLEQVGESAPSPTGAWHNPFRNSFFHNPFFDNEAF